MTIMVVSLTAGGARRARDLALARALPCVVCFSPADPLVRDSVNAGIVVLLGVTAFVLTAFAAFIVRVARRSKKPGLVFTPEGDFQTGFRDV
jgi:hypothetical protein